MFRHFNNPEGKAPYDAKFGIPRDDWERGNRNAYKQIRNKPEKTRAWATKFHAIHAVNTNLPIYEDMDTETREMYVSFRHDAFFRRAAEKRSKAMAKNKKKAGGEAYPVASVVVGQPAAAAAVVAGHHDDGAERARETSGADSDAGSGSGDTESASLAALMAKHAADRAAWEKRLGALTKRVEKQKERQRADRAKAIENGRMLDHICRELDALKAARDTTITSSSPPPPPMPPMPPMPPREAPKAPKASRAREAPKAPKAPKAREAPKAPKASKKAVVVDAAPPAAMRRPEMGSIVSYIHNGRRNRGKVVSILDDDNSAEHEWYRVMERGASLMGRPVMVPLRAITAVEEEEEDGSASDS